MLISSQDRHQPAKDMRGIGTRVAANFFIENRGNRPHEMIHLTKPVLKPQIPHATTIISAGAKADRAAAERMDFVSVDGVFVNSFGFRRSLHFAHGWAIETEPEGVVDEPIKNGVRGRRAH